MIENVRTPIQLNDEVLNDMERVIPNIKQITEKINADSLLILYTGEVDMANERDDVDVAFIFLGAKHSFVAFKGQFIGSPFPEKGTFFTSTSYIDTIEDFGLIEMYWQEWQKGDYEVDRELLQLAQDAFAQSYLVEMANGIALNIINDYSPIVTFYDINGVYDLSKSYHRERLRNIKEEIDKALEKVEKFERLSKKTKKQALKM